MKITDLYGDMKKIAEDQDIAFVEYLMNNFAGEKLYIPTKLSKKQLVIKHIEENKITVFDEEFYRKTSKTLDIKINYLRNIITTMYRK